MATRWAAAASRRVESSVGNEDTSGVTKQEDFGTDQSDGGAAQTVQPTDDVEVALPGCGGEHSFAQLGEDDVIDQAAFVGVRDLGGDSLGRQDAWADRAGHRVFGTEHANPPIAFRGGLLRDDFGDVQARQRQIFAVGLQRHVGGVVGADKEFGAGRRRGVLRW